MQRARNGRIGRLTSLYNGPAVLAGAGIGLAVIAGLALWAQLLSGSTMAAREARLSSSIVQITEAEGPRTPSDSAAKSASAPATTTIPAPNHAEQTGHEPSQHAESANAPNAADMHAAGPATTTAPAPAPAPAPSPSDANGLVPLQRAPVPGLSVKSQNGLLPQIHLQTGLTPFEAYRRPYDTAESAGKKTISLVLTDIGLSSLASEAAITGLPEEITFALSPYAATPDIWAAQARANGHEFLMMLPLETGSYPNDDSGPQTLLTTVQVKENIQKLEWLMGRATGYIGFLTPANSRFDRAPSELRPIVEAINSRGLMIATTGAALPEGLVPAASPLARIDVAIDADPQTESIRARLAELEAIAMRNGHASGAMQPLPVSFREVKAWIATLPQKNLAFVPLSAQAVR